jgi:predicted alpha/beta-hydrolase family hydrolase
MSGPLFVFAHGAGAGSSHPWMQAWAERLASVGSGSIANANANANANATIVTFDYPYVQRGGRMPDRAPTLLAEHLRVLEEARAQHTGPVYLIGKSMGSRMGCHLNLEQPAGAIAGLICLGYPLVSPGKSRKRRDEVLLAQSGAPILFVQGTRDRLCPLDVLAEVRPRMTIANHLHVVETGDHSLLITRTHTKETGQTQEQADADIVSAIADFVRTTA